MNWSTIEYVIEGPNKDLSEIKNAVPNTEKILLFKVLENLGIKVENECSVNGRIINWFDKDETIRIFTREAWGRSDFAEYLKEKYPLLKIYYQCLDFNIGLFETNDINHKYFKAVYYADFANYDKEDLDIGMLFSSESSLLKWLSEKLDRKITSLSEIDFDSYNDNRHLLEVKPIRYFDVNLIK